MITRMPTIVKGKAVHLEQIKSQTTETASVWDTILKNIGRGEWFTVITTAHLADEEKRKLFNSLVNRVWFAGYNAEHLWMKMTEAEGLCFRWTCGKPPEKAEVEANRTKRLEARRAKQKESRAVKRKVEAENATV